MFDGKGGEHLIQNGQSNGGDFNFNGRKWELFSILNDEIPVRKESRSEPHSGSFMTVTNWGRTQSIAQSGLSSNLRKWMHTKKNGEVEKGHVQ